MNIQQLQTILRATTTVFRKGEEITEETVGNVNVINVYAMPHVSKAPRGLEMIDVEFMVVGVNKAEAQKRQGELIATLRDYPEPERLANGPSFIEVGAHVGSQDNALRLFALGQVLGLWTVVTPAMMRIPPQGRRDAAGQGFLFVTGYRGN